MRLVEPAEPGGIESHQRLVPERGEPRGGPVPEEERAHEDHRHRQDEDQDRLPPTKPHGERGHRGEDDRRQAEHDRGNDVGRQQERPSDLVGLGVRKDVIGEHRPELLEDEDPDERDEDGEKLAPNILVGGQRRGMQDLADPALVVLDDTHPGGDRQEENVEEEDRHGQRVRDRELGGDPSLRAADRRVAAVDAHVPRRKPPDRERHDDDQNPRQRPLRLHREVGLEDEEEPSQAHRAASSRASPRMRTKYASSRLGSTATNPSGGRPAGS